jgi:hypothetical protein
MYYVKPLQAEAQASLARRPGQQVIHPYTETWLCISLPSVHCVCVPVLEDLTRTRAWRQPHTGTTS